MKNRLLLKYAALTLVLLLGVGYSALRYWNSGDPVPDELAKAGATGTVLSY